MLLVSINKINSNVRGVSAARPRSLGASVHYDDDDDDDDDNDRISASTLHVVATAAIGAKCLDACAIANSKYIRAE